MEITEEQRAALVDVDMFVAGALACVDRDRKETMLGWALDDLDRAGGVAKARFMLFLLADETHGMMRFATEVERPAVQNLIDLWTREAAGERVANAAWAAAGDAAMAAAWAAARGAAEDAAEDAARDAAWDAAIGVQINQLRNEMRRVL